jgi:hypothetical protein
MKTNNLYTTENGGKTFSGVIDKTKKGIIHVIDDIMEATTINNNVPVGIDLLLFRNMEDFIEVNTLHVKAKRII